jgi:glycosyltransferase involved in cell wall biosynthesis
MSQKRVGIIIPAYNEEKRIGETLKEYCRYFASNDISEEIDILVVLNNCSDNTIDIVLDYEERYENLFHLNLKPGGKGFAITEGFKYFLEKFRDNEGKIGFVDADNATSPQAFSRLIVNLGKNDGIIASRYLKNSIVKPKQSFQRILASRIFNFLIRILFWMNYRDTQCGAKLFSRRGVETILDDLKITKWAFDVNLLYLCKLKRLKILEDSTVWKDKEYSKINLSQAGIQMFFSLIRLRLVYSPFKKIVKIYDNLPMRIKINV